jgi:hypothetical protein
MKTIKRIYVITLITSLVFLFEGCKKDDPAPTPAEQLVGSWKEVNRVSTGCTDPADNRTETCTTGCENMVASSTTLTFTGEPPYPYTADGNTLTVTVGTQVFKVTILITGTTLTFTIQDSAADGNCKSVTTYSKI